MLRVASLLQPLEHDRLRASLAGTAAVTSFASAEALLAALKGQDIDLVVTDCRDELGGDATAALREAASHGFPGRILLKIALRRDAIRGALALAEGSSQVNVAIEGYDDVVAIASRLIKQPGGAESARSALFRSLQRKTVAADPVVVGAVALGLPRRSPLLLSALVGVSHRTLLRLTEAADLPVPHLLIGWSCCLQCTWLLELAGWTAKTTAQAAGFRSIQAFNHYVARYTGMPPLTLSRTVGFFELADRWTASWGRRGPR